MTLTLSQKALFFLFLGGFLLGILTAFLYGVTGLFLIKKPRSRAGRLVFSLFLHLRDFSLFTLLGVADAILFFTFNSGRVRILVFVLNLFGFLFCRFCILRPIGRCISRFLFSKRDNKKDSI